MAAIDAARALEMVGVPFRPQGRNRMGLDCVGLCLLAYRLPIDTVRADYRLRGDFRCEIKAILSRHFRRVDLSNELAGDLMLMRTGSDQLHLAVRTRRGIVHADARLRRVVETPGEPTWPVISVHRRRRERAR